MSVLQSVSHVCSQRAAGAYRGKGFRQMRKLLHVRVGYYKERLNAELGENAGYFLAGAAEKIDDIDYRAFFSGRLNDARKNGVKGGVESRSPDFGTKSLAMHRGYGNAQFLLQLVRNALQIFADDR